MIGLKIEQKQGKIKLHITDYGIGITEKNQAYIFDGLFHTKETELYGSKKPYDFGAGGKFRPSPDEGLWTAVWV